MGVSRDEMGSVWGRGEGGERMDDYTKRFVIIGSRHLNINPGKRMRLCGGRWGYVDGVM